MNHVTFAWFDSAHHDRHAERSRSVKNSVQVLKSAKIGVICGCERTQIYLQRHKFLCKIIDNLFARFYGYGVVARGRIRADGVCEE
jgi:hypothetical protein